MINLTKEQFSDIENSTLLEYPNEMCGIISDGKFIKLQNIHEDPINSFKFDMLEFDKVRGDNVECIVHSHTRDVKTQLQFDLRTPSFKDKINQAKLGIPWLIVATEGEIVQQPIELPRTPNDKYNRRRFMWYINDCYTLIEDYYKFEMDIILKPASDDFDWSDLLGPTKMFEKYIIDYGFYDIENVEDIQNGDILILNTVGLKANHLGVYHDDYVLEQLGLSIKKSFSNYVGKIHRILRYENNISS